jgi:hypothetical protein
MDKRRFVQKIHCITVISGSFSGIDAPNKSVPVWGLYPDTYGSIHAQDRLNRSFSSVDPKTKNRGIFHFGIRLKKDH